MRGLLIECQDSELAGVIIGGQINLFGTSKRATAVADVNPVGS